MLKKEGRKAIREYQGTDKLFKDACVLADCRPTYRQWRKWENRRGAAFAKRHEASQAQQVA